MTVLATWWGCTGDKAPPDHSGAPEEGFVTVAEGLPSALLSVTGAGPDDVWAVGADADGTGPYVLHGDGGTFSRVDVGSPGDLWWAWRAGADALWIAGAGGRIVRYTPSSGTSTVDTTVASVTLFGLWGASTDDVWAVGGDLALADGAAVFHYDGAAWTPAVLPAEADAAPAIYKVWGTGPTDVWACGYGGLVLHWDGSAWETVPTGAGAPLFTIHGGGADDVWAVGGAGNGVALHWDGTAFADRSPEFVETLQGVFVGDDGPVVVGWGGRVFGGDAGGLTEDPRGRATFQDLHAVWGDGDGGWWMVGGALGGTPLTDGTLVYSGAAPPAPFVP